MTPRDNTEAVLAAWFLETAPAIVPAGLHDDVIERARALHQRGHRSARILAALAPQMSRRTMRVGVLVLAVVALLIAVVIATGLTASVRRNESPSLVHPTAPDQSIAVVRERLTEQRFDVPFTYGAPSDNGLKVDDTKLPKVIRWKSPDYAITVASVDPAWGHGNERVFLAKDPEGFLQDIHEKLGIKIGRVEPTTIDGRPAMTTTTLDGAQTHLHLNTKITGLAGDGDVELDGPYRLIAAEINGSLIMVEISSPSADGLTAWSPVAQEFVDSIEFTPTPTLTTRRTTSQPVVDVTRIRYQLPQTASLTETGAIPGTAIAFSVGPNNPIPGRTDGTEGERAVYAGQLPDTGNQHGILVGYAMSVWGYTSKDRIALRPTPAGFLADMSQLAGFDLERASSAVLDGRPAVMARGRGLPGRTVLHLTGMSGFPGPGIAVAESFQWIVADIDGTTVFVEVWAKDDADLDAWLPLAQAFVDSLDFDAR